MGFKRNIIKARRTMDQEPPYHVLEQTFLEKFSCWNTNVYQWPIKLNVWRQLEQKVVEWATTVKMVQIGLNSYLEVEGKVTDLKFKLTKCFCRIDVLSNLDEIVSSHEGFTDAPVYDKFKFEKLFNLTELYKKSPNLYHQVEGRPNTLAMTLTIGPCKDERIKSVKPQKQMLDEKILTDIIIKTKTADFPCHKFILATYSEYFRAMFQANMKESDENVIDWVDVFDSETVKDLLHYLYTGDTPPNIKATYPTLIEAADLCLLDQLKDICSETLVNIMNIENAGTILEIAEKFELASLRESAVLYVLDNYQQVPNTRGFQTMNSEIKTRLFQKVFQILGKNIVDDKSLGATPKATPIATPKQSIHPLGFTRPV